MRHSFVLATSIALAILTGCATTDEHRDPTVPISVATSPYEVSPLDSVAITQPDGSRETLVVDQDGRLLIGGDSVPVRGQSVAAVTSRVRRAHPRAAAIEFTEFRTNRITVLGEVFHQIHTDLGDGPLRVMDAIATANGFTPLANKRRVKLLRQNAGRIEVYEFDLREMLQGRDLVQNFLLQPGDVITVPRNFL